MPGQRRTLSGKGPALVPQSSSSSSGLGVSMSQTDAEAALAEATREVNSAKERLAVIKARAYV